MLKGNLLLCNTIGTKHDSQGLTLTRFATEYNKFKQIKKREKMKRIVQHSASKITSQPAQFTNFVLLAISHTNLPVTVPVSRLSSPRN